MNDMNLQDLEIEKLLRRPPSPAPIVGLKEQLAREIDIPLRKRPEPLRVADGGWFKKWWPVLVPGAASLACGLAVSVQQIELGELQRTVASLQQAVQGSEVPGTAPASSPIAETAVLDEGQEIERLTRQAAALRTEIAALEKLLQENSALRARLASTPLSLTSEEQAALEAAKEKASAIQCVNNLKQLGLAVRVYAVDNKEVSPPTLLAMSNEMGSPKILVCPADSQRVAATNWDSFTSGNCSYEYLMANTPTDQDPSQVMFRCPFHGSITLADGSVQMAVAKNHPENLVEQNGKLFYRSSTAPAGTAPSSGPGTPQGAVDAFKKRYGLQ